MNYRYTHTQYTKNISQISGKLLKFCSEQQTSITDVAFFDAPPTFLLKMQCIVCFSMLESKEMLGKLL